MLTVTSVEAQNNFGQLLDTVQREPITITRRGRPVAMLMAVGAFEERLGSRDATRAAIEAITTFRGAGKGGTVEQLFADRRAEAVHEPVAHYAVKRSTKPKPARATKAGKAGK
ncbi:type II toxin-antitoxin system Phd/YefM family antitoxin [Caenimonas sp. SL110]|uniref:type II toxin-antitoxin system Phd/YefM family antitoxin n=1 Tax=Caenimonas sp. SL110 TaxID=1450524 RepID=UPI0009E65E66|nr:type II toxin-antitoxin system Phd/YefM family antitoxin [Caenimonas sp. SL110]